MKKIEAIIAPFKFDEVNAALAKKGVQGLTCSKVRKWDPDGGLVALHRGVAYVEEFRPKAKIEVLIEDEEVQAVVDTIFGVLRTGRLGDGQVVVLSAEKVIRVRTGVREMEVLRQRNGAVRGESEAVRAHHHSGSARAA